MSTFPSDAFENAPGLLDHLTDLSLLPITSAVCFLEVAGDSIVTIGLEEHVVFESSRQEKKQRISALHASFRSSCHFHSRVASIGLCLFNFI